MTEAPRPGVVERSTAPWRAARTAIARPGPRQDPLVWAGAAALVAAVSLAVAAPPTLISVPLGFAAVIGLSRHPRLGPLPAALLAVLAVPYGRAADVGLAAVDGTPVRFHDAALVAAAILSLRQVRLPLPRSDLATVALLWLAIGVFAIGVGIGSGNEARDVIRDARWWFMYGFAVVAIWTATRRPAVLRAVLVGSIAYSAILIAITLLPAFEGGLKERAATYDRGLLRLQFSNGVFVVFAAVWVINRWLRAPSRQGALWIPVLAAGVLLSLTRMSIFVLAALVAVSLILAIRRPAAVRSSLRPGRRALVVTALSVLPIAVAVSVMAGGAGGSDPTGPYRNLLQRFLFQDPASDVGAITEGRVETYRSALKLIGEHPIVGNGLGKLVDFGYVPGGARPATPGKQPSVDNAYLTVAMKAGFLGVCVFTVLAVWPLEELRRRPRDRWARPFLLSWLAILILTMTQSFATGGYSPFGLALLIAATAARPAALTLPGGVPPDRIQPTASAR